ncbi:hypothetical protein [Nonomuraea salmonea]|uniref:hypothetical protein n=1 Tax=Nonomuraea salmonea TaxID=46181 RepID=UPI0031EACD7A
MTDETRAGRTIDEEDGVLGGEAALLHAQDDPTASAAVDAAVETELLEDAPAREAVEARRESERQIADLTAQDQQRFRDLQRELRTMGADVWPISRWWGFEIHLNESAALLAAEIPQLIAQSAATIVGGWLTPVIERAVRGKAAWIASIARPYGVKLVSPWTAPGMLVPARQDGRPAGENGLYWAVHEPEQGWSADQRFVDHFSVTGPALGEFQDRLFLAHRGGAGDASLWWTVYDAEEGWSEDQRFPQHLSQAAPALAAYDGQLYCVHRGAGDDTALWWTRFDGSSWSPDERLPRHFSERAGAGGVRRAALLRAPGRGRRRSVVDALGRVELEPGPAAARPLQPLEPGAGRLPRSPLLRAQGRGRRHRPVVDALGRLDVEPRPAAARPPRRRGPRADRLQGPPLLRAPRHRRPEPVVEQLQRLRVELRRAAARPPQRREPGHHGLPRQERHPRPAPGPAPGSPLSPHARVPARTASRHPFMAAYQPASWSRNHSMSGLDTAPCSVLAVSQQNASRNVSSFGRSPRSW